MSELYYRIEGGQMHMDEDRMVREAKLQANRTNEPVQMLRVRRTDTITKLYLVRPDKKFKMPTIVGLRRAANDYLEVYT